MKFWRILSKLIEETLPDWRDEFLSYKYLKKQLKLIYPQGGENRGIKRPRWEVEEKAAENGGGDEAVVTKEVNAFQKLLEVEIEKFNAFYDKKEEWYVIAWKELQGRIAAVKDSDEELMKVRREIVDFYGEMVLLKNYCQLNFIGLVKIIKKYDKRSGDLIRLPFIQKVLQQPFFTTDVLNKLVKECEVILNHIFDKESPTATSVSTEEEEESSSMTVTENKEGMLKVPNELAEIKNLESMFMKLTLSALRTLEEIRGGSSTVSEFSLPPLNANATE
ncbi:SPX domain-containing protein [Quillaja saponaria]|uniref:SPX domain-containing protein n=1 Tax=Quillaja saponaria TaxID=32244 RepID=A0AAD7PL33_QUISA|nr:SPX domain-containing protein [Quillaja saponaria]